MLHEDIPVVPGARVDRVLGINPTNYSNHVKYYLLNVS